MSIGQIFNQVDIIFLLMLLGAVIRKLGFLHPVSIIVGTTLIKLINIIFCMSNIIFN